DGYSDAAVTFDDAKFQQSGELVYQIQEGLQVRIRKIVFEGNQAFDARPLSGQIETKTAFWIFRTGAFDQDRAEGDVGRIRNSYQDDGYLDAKASFRKELAKNGKDLTVIFTVEEGTRYVVEDVQIRGNAVLTTDELLEAMKSRVGETVKRPQVDADVKAIRDHYGELGYIYAEVKATRVFSDTPGAIRIAIDVKEGDRFKVGRVVVRGNARTKDKVVRRALDLYPPDDVFNLVEAREAEKRLAETRIFSSAKVVPVGDEPGVRDAVIDVKESEKSGDFLFGFGVTSNSGLVGSVVLDLQNFDLFDKPKSLAEFFKFRSFFGGGQRMRIEVQPGTEVSRFRVDFTEPYLFDKPLRFDLGLYLFSRGRDGYEERRVGSTVALGKRFDKGALEGWAGEIAARVEEVN
ncbi:MAG: BamA/OMP85 family outer membrane protein, partial [Thermoplasmata archaeon]